MKLKKQEAYDQLINQLMTQQDQLGQYQWQLLSQFRNQLWRIVIPVGHLHDRIINKMSTIVTKKNNLDNPDVT